MKPNKKNLRKWVAALRSGKYKQGKYALRVGDRFCCLGVACDISKKAEWRETRNTFGAGRAYAYSGTEVYLPKVVRDWLGVDAADALTGCKKLSVLNDGGARFTTIANLIEKEFDL